MRLPTTTRGRVLLGAVVAAQAVGSVLAWRDLAERSEDEVRGPKSLWRFIVTINPGNSLVYWLVGRR